MAHPICGDYTKIRAYYYCEDDSRCFALERARAKYRRLIDIYFGDICEEAAIACPC